MKNNLNRLSTIFFIMWTFMFFCWYCFAIFFFIKLFLDVGFFFSSERRFSSSIMEYPKSIINDPVYTTTKHTILFESSVQGSPPLILTLNDRGNIKLSATHNVEKTGISRTLEEKKKFVKPMCCLISFTENSQKMEEE